MIEPPDLSDDVIQAAVYAGYGFHLATLAFLPVGRDSAAWVYRALAADGAAYFLKVRAGVPNPAGLIVPRYLRDHNVTQVVAPIPTREGALWVAVDGYALILYPFIDGTTGVDRGMEERHWVAYGAVLRQIHAAALPPDLAGRVRRDVFTPAGADLVMRLEGQIATRTFADLHERELAAFWDTRRAEIRRLVERAEALGRRLRASTPPRVLCHADIHTWNVLIDAGDRLWIVDWDETLFAPRECDLMFVVGGLGGNLVGPREEAWFRAGYGRADIDPLALAYYRHARAVADIAAFGERVFLAPDAGEATKRDSVRGLKSLFAPGNIIALALKPDRPAGSQ
jgi:spectinomycin phosphotransferase